MKELASKNRKRVLRDNAFRSVFRHEPERVRVVREKEGDEAARDMAIAIALDEARRAGVE